MSVHFPKLDSSIVHIGYLAPSKGFKYHDQYQCTECAEIWSIEHNGAPREIVCAYCTDVYYRCHVEMCRAEEARK